MVFCMMSVASSDNELGGCRRRLPWLNLKYCQFALTSPTSSGRSVGIVCSRTEAMQFSFLVLVLHLHGGTEENYKNIVIACVLVKIRTKHLPKTSEVLLFDPVSLVKCVISEGQMQSPLEAILHNFSHIYTVGASHPPTILRTNEIFHTCVL
jgi:hypothetical protein